ncbi:MAG: hypothetical protein LN413_00570 [Candidatus Thermoplasmatota archaeon]|nr:hypothetical protein [Candidatus Thermoplasmatota archaeon]
MKEPDPYVEGETARIDSLIQELQAERLRIIKEGNAPERPDKLPDAIKDHIVQVGLGRFIHALLGGRSTYHLRTWVFPWAHASFEVHGLMDLDHDQFYALAQTEFGADTPEDGEPALSVEIMSCNEHLDCMYLEVDVFFSENDWKMLTEENGS